MSDHLAARQHGHVRWFCADRGFGFVAPDAPGDDVFVSWHALPDDGFRVLQAGDGITFVAGVDEHGPTALEVQRDAAHASVA